MATITLLSLYFETILFAHSRVSSLGPNSREMTMNSMPPAWKKLKLFSLPSPMRPPYQVSDS